MFTEHTICIRDCFFSLRECIGLGLSGLGVFYTLAGAAAISNHIIPMNLSVSWAITTPVLLTFVACIAQRLLDENDLGGEDTLPEG